ncbi:MAG TPA: hypothetical protein VK027_08655 [Chitinophagaceae bacterium]|nr:hypothetical protein [Chitinophagaceae bacterium]
MKSRTNKNKFVVIESIGKASPLVGKWLSDTLGISENLILQLLYNAPKVLFKDIEEDLALKTKKFLESFGLEISIWDSLKNYNESLELFDVAIYIEDPLLLPKVSQQLAAFIGCSVEEAMNLLLKSPSKIIGGVSLATVKAIKSRIDAQVMYVNPEKDTYLLFLKDKSNYSLIQQIKTHFQNSRIPFNENNQVSTELTFENAQSFWRQFGNQKGISLLNKAFLRYELILEEFDLNNSMHKTLLYESIGIPEEILEDLYKNLPIQLKDNILLEEAQVLKEQLFESGMQSTILPVLKELTFLKVKDIEDANEFRAFLKDFYPKEKLKVKNNEWKSPTPINYTLSRYMEAILEKLNYRVELNFIE